MQKRRSAVIVSDCKRSYPDTLHVFRLRTDLRFLTIFMFLIQPLAPVFNNVDKDRLYVGYDALAYVRALETAHFSYPYMNNQSKTSKNH